MITSMTGFGRAGGALSPRYFATVTTKSVNHRFLEVGVRLPEYMWDLEAPLRALASEYFSRGKVDLSIRIQRTQQPDHPFLHQLKPGHRLRPAIDASDAGDQRQERLDQLLPRTPVARLGGRDEPLLDSHRESGAAAELAQISRRTRLTADPAAAQVIGELLV